MLKSKRWQNQRLAYPHWSFSLSSFLFNLTKHMNLRHELFFSFFPSVQLNNLTNLKNKGEENNLYILFLFFLNRIYKNKIKYEGLRLYRKKKKINIYKTSGSDLSILHEWTRFNLKKKRKKKRQNKKTMRW